MPSQPLDPDSPQRSTKVARWGLWAMTVSMALALMLGALFAWQSSQTAAETLAHARATDVYQLLRREMRGSVQHLGDALESVPEEFTEAGLRYVAVYSPQGEIRYQWGQATVEQPLPIPSAVGRGRNETHAIQSGDRTRMQGSLGGRGPGRQPGWLIVEVESQLALSLQQNARVQLILSGVVALALLGCAWLFWRMARRADASEAALARDRRLAALGEMSAILGHELRNPLASLKGHAQLALERTPPTERNHKNLTRVVSEAERMEHLMGHILSFAKDRVLERQHHRLGDLLTELESHFDVKLYVVGKADLVDKMVHLDKAAILQVMDNLVQNASEAAPSQPVELHCEVHPGRFTFIVSDRGPGFPRDEAGHLIDVFEPFKSHNKVYGTGLGLAIAKRIVQAHGGSITLGDRAGGGATVTVSIPQSV